ncbi:MAG: hypothetical protein RL318_361, partial [Fibrobacterota bacterium]
MNSRFLSLLPAICLPLFLGSCEESTERITASSNDEITLAPRLLLAQGADTALYNSTLNVRVRLDAGSIHRDTLVAFSLHKCNFEGLASGSGYSLTFSGVNAKGDTLWRGTKSGVVGKDLSLGVTRQTVDVPVQFADREPPKLVSGPSDSVVRAGVGQIELDWFVQKESGLTANLDGVALPVSTNGLIHASQTLQEGPNRIVLTVRDSAANAVSDTVWVTRRPVVIGPDFVAPILLSSPVDTLVPGSTSGLTLNWLVASESGLSATLDGVAAVIHGDTIRGTVMLAEGVTRHLLKVTDTAGNDCLDTVMVTRQAVRSDVVAPTLQSSPRDTTVPNATNQWLLNWTIKNELGLVARLDGVLLNGAEGVYSKTVSLAEGANHFAFAAVDSAGNTAVDTVWITREPVKDMDAPVILNAPNDTVLTDSVKTFVPRWKVRLEPKMSVTINGVAISDSAGLFKREIVLDSHYAQVVLVVRDSMGNERKDTMRVTRAPKAGISTIPWNSVMIYGTLVDDRDGQIYKTIGIGRQMWMAENLNYSSGGSVGKCYNNSTDSCSKYGRLYTWEEAMNGAPSSAEIPSEVKGVCPTGWHVPSDGEWDTLISAVGGTSTAGGKLKSTVGWSSNATDDFGFRSLGSGSFDGKTFSLVGKYAPLWSATDNDAINAWYYTISDGLTTIGRAYNPKTLGFSVRCVKDPASFPSFYPSGGLFSNAQRIALSTTSPNATIYYTTDGSIPTISSSVYTGQISVVSNVTIRAMAMAPGMSASRVHSASYVINAGSGA